MENKNVSQLHPTKFALGIINLQKDFSKGRTLTINNTKDINMCTFLLQLYHQKNYKSFKDSRLNKWLNNKMITYLVIV